MNTIQDVPTLLRREIEAGFAYALINEFAEELGRDKTIEITRRAVAKMAKDAGNAAAARAGGNTFKAFAGIFPHFADDPAVDAELAVSGDGKCLRMNVTRCQYAELYQRLGLEELGAVLSCERDPSFFEGFSPEIEFSREHTILGGDAYCDFCMKAKEQG